MKSARLALAVLVVATVALGFLLVVRLGTASANTPVSVPLGNVGFVSLAVDDGNQHVFVSAPNANEVLVLDFQGIVVATIPSQYGAAGMAIVGPSLYVAQSTAGRIERINLSTLADEGSLASGLIRPYWLVEAGGRLWTAVNLDYQSRQLASIALTGAVTTFAPQYYDPDLASSPGDPNGLYLSKDGLSPGTIYRFDVSSGTPTTTSSNTFTPQENIEQMTVSPDGTRVIPAAGYPYEFDELSASTLQPDGIIYPAQAYPSAVAVSSGQGGLLATGLDSGYSSPDISVFRIGTPQAIFTATTQNSSGTANVVPHGLALTGDGTVLFAVTADDVYSDSFTLHVFSLAPQTPKTTTPTATQTPTPTPTATPVQTVAFLGNIGFVSVCGGRAKTLSA